MDFRLEVGLWSVVFCQCLKALKHTPTKHFSVENKSFMFVNSHKGSFLKSKKDYCFSGLWSLTKLRRNVDFSQTEGIPCHQLRKTLSMGCVRTPNGCWLEQSVNLVPSRSLKDHFQVPVTVREERVEGMIAFDRKWNLECGVHTARSLEQPDLLDYKEFCNHSSAKENEMDVMTSHKGTWRSNLVSSHWM